MNNLARLNNANNEIVINVNIEPNRDLQGQGNRNEAGPGQQLNPNRPPAN